MTCCRIFLLAPDFAILFGACWTGNGAQRQDGVVFFENRHHGGIDAATVKQDSEPLPWFQSRAVADDPSLIVCDDAIAACQHGARVKVGESVAQAGKVGRPRLPGFVPGTAQAWRQACQPAGVARRIRAAEQQPTAEAGHAAARLRAGLQEAGTQSALEIAQRLPLNSQRLRRVL